MKKIIFITFLILIKFCFCQTTHYIYEYSSIPDSTDRKNIIRELTVLSISNNQSEFYSLNQFKNDSIIVSSISKGFPPPPQSVANKHFRIIKSVPNKTINYITPIGENFYDVSQKIDLTWKIENEKQQILNYAAQKATVNYGGRKWIAWFTTDIPIQDGPYKFFNLPGLILKIEDSGLNHVFEIKGINKKTEPFTYPQNNYISNIKIPYSAYKKIYIRYRSEPIADIIDKIQDVKDPNGGIIPRSKIIRELTELSLKEIEKDNNLIEIDLLEQKK